MSARLPPARTLTVELLSDATFGRGVGTAGEVDVEVEHDPLGLPLLGGKTLHGLLRDAWLTMAPHFPELAEAARRVLGPGGEHDETSVLRVGDATVDDVTRAWVAWACGREHNRVAPADVLRALTDIRHQTALERQSGAPAAPTLRASRVVLRGLTLRSRLDWLEPEQPGADEVCCLALCTLAVRHAGLGRHRGRGHVRVSLDGDLDATRQAARGGAG